jgi:sugar phosphate isomerase/epimerase
MGHLLGFENVDGKAIMSGFGVSPAYFISRFGDDFTPADIIASIPHLHEEGYASLQVEIRYAEALERWDRPAIEGLQRACREHGMRVSQFVCHHWMDDLSQGLRILQPVDVDSIERTLAIADHLPGCRQITVPFAKGAVDSRQVMDPAKYARIQAVLLERIAMLLARIKNHGKRMAVELQPGAFISGTDGYLQLCRQLGDDPDLCFNFDTGHAHACKELVHLIPYKLGARIIGTHLCDNRGHENHSWAPGDGTIAWPELFISLAQTGYQGPYDIEILCPPEHVEDDYRRARQFITTFVGNAGFTR